MNVFTFTGNLGSDCDVRFTQSGMAVCSFNVAVSSGYGDKEKTTWARCDILGKRAEGKLPEHLTKGQKVAVSGELTLDEWQDQQGAKQKMLKVTVNTLDLIGVKSEAPQRQAPAQQQAPQQTHQPSAGDGFPDFTDDIPY